MLLALLIGGMPLIQLGTKCYQKHQIKLSLFRNPSSLPLTKIIIRGDHPLASKNIQPMDEIEFQETEYDVIKVEHNATETILWVFKDNLETQLSDQAAHSNKSGNKIKNNFFKIDAIVQELAISEPARFETILSVQPIIALQNEALKVVSPPPQG
jgi:hypothetical protein